MTPLSVFHDDRPALTPTRLLLFATAAGVMVANLYYAQPLLAEIGQSLSIPTPQAGLLSTVTQLGYGLGVLFIVPLGDMLDRRNLASCMLAACVAGLLLAAVSPNFTVLAIASLIFGITASATMVIIPYVASHAAESERGRRVGQIMTGLLLGILLARTVSGFVAAWAGWRSIYLLAALAVASVGVALRFAMRADTRQRPFGYGKLLRSLWLLIGSEPTLRQRSFYTFLGLGSFSALWTGLTFLLTAPPYGYSTEIVGLFGLLGAAGALSANLAGRLGDKGLAQPITGVFAGLMLFSWLLLAGGERNLALLVIGIFLVDVAAQGLQVTHQSVLYRLAPDARSRITAVFITLGFIGMSLGSALASAGYASYGWKGVCAVGAVCPALLVLHWIFSGVRNRQGARGRHG